MKLLRTLIASFLAACFLSMTTFAAEVSPAGIWTWTVQGRQGGKGFEQSLKLDYKDGKLSGVMKGQQGGQFSVPDTEITEASFSKDGRIAFAITREFNGRSFKTTYAGKLEGDTIKGTFERTIGNGPVKTDWLAHRQK